jgi:hypothetical protein
MEPFSDGEEKLFVLSEFPSAKSGEVSNAKRE